MKRSNEPEKWINSECRRSGKLRNEGENLTMDLSSMYESKVVLLMTGQW